MPNGFFGSASKAFQSNFARSHANALAQIREQKAAKARKDAQLEILEKNDELQRERIVEDFTRGLLLEGVQQGFVPSGVETDTQILNSGSRPANFGQFVPDQVATTAQGQLNLDNLGTAQSGPDSAAKDAGEAGIAEQFATFRRDQRLKAEALRERDNDLELQDRLLKRDLTKLRIAQEKKRGVREAKDRAVRRAEATLRSLNNRAEEWRRRGEKFNDPVVQALNRNNPDFQSEFRNYQLEGEQIQAATQEMESFLSESIGVNLGFNSQPVQAPSEAPAPQAAPVNANQSPNVSAFGAFNVSRNDLNDKQTARLDRAEDAFGEARKFTQLGMGLSEALIEVQKMEKFQDFDLLEDIRLSANLTQKSSTTRQTQSKGPKSTARKELKLLKDERIEMRRQAVRLKGEEKKAMVERISAITAQIKAKERELKKK